VIVFYAAVDGLGRADYHLLRERLKSPPLLLTYYNVVVNSRQTWVFKRIVRGKKRIGKSR